MISRRSFALIATLVVQHDTDKFFNTSFPEDRCEVITTDENELATCDDLMQIVRDKLECLQFIRRNVKECDHVRLPV